MGSRNPICTAFVPSGLWEKIKANRFAVDLGFHGGQGGT